MNRYTMQNLDNQAFVIIDSTLPATEATVCIWSKLAYAQRHIAVLNRDKSRDTFYRWMEFRSEQWPHCKMTFCPDSVVDFTTSQTTREEWKRMQWNKRVGKLVQRVGELCHYECYHLLRKGSFRTQDWRHITDEWGYIHTIPVHELPPNENGDIEYENESASYGDLKNCKLDEQPITELYVMPRYCSGSDYSGGSVEASNCRVLLAEFGGIAYEDDYVGKVDGNATFAGVHAVYGGHGTFAVAIRLDTFLRCKELREMLNGLDNYPLINEEDMTFLEMQWQDENWENWARDDFRRELKKHLGVDDIEWQSSSSTDEKTREEEQRKLDGNVRQFFEECREACNVYWENEQGDSMHVDLTRIVKSIVDVDYVPKHSHSGLCLRDIITLESMINIDASGADDDDTSDNEETINGANN